MAAGGRRRARNYFWNCDLFYFAEQAERGGISNERGKRLGASRTGTRATSEARSKTNRHVASAHYFSRVARGAHRVCDQLRRVHADLLDAAVDQVRLAGNFEHGGGFAGDDSPCGGAGGDGFYFAKLG